MVGSLDDICLRYFVVLRHNTTASCNYLVHGLNILSLLSPDSVSALIQKPLISLQLPITLPDGRHSHCAVKYGRGVIIIGGLNAAMMPISSCLQLSWYTGDWHLDEIMFEPPLPPRCVYDTGWACVRAQVLQEFCIPMTSPEISLPGKISAAGKSECCGRLLC